MGQRVGWHRDKSAAQQRLIEEVERLARYRDKAHVLVFDARPKTLTPRKSNEPLSTVRYAQSGGSADELILELVYRHNFDTDVTVVTSDRALTRQIRILGAKVMRSGVFRRMLDAQS